MNINMLKSDLNHSAIGRHLRVNYVWHRVRHRRELEFLLQHFQLFLCPKSADCYNGLAGLLGRN